MRFRTSIVALAMAVVGFVALPAPAQANPYCGELDTVCLVVMAVAEKVDCKVFHNCY